MGIVREYLLVSFILVINLIATFIYLVFLSNESRKRMPVLLQKLLVVLFVGPLFIAPFLPQVRINFAIYDFIKIPVSLLLIVGGLIFIGFAFLKIGAIPSLKAKSSLITQGVYRIVRHPIYCGTLITFLGLILWTNTFVSLFYFPISILLYFIMTVYEEKSLIGEYGQEYIDYQKRVRKRIIPFVL